MPSQKKSNLSRKSRNALSKQLVRSQESEEGRDERLSQARARQAASLSAETASQREARLRSQRIRTADARLAENEEDYALRLSAARERRALSLISETFTERSERLASQRTRTSFARSQVGGEVSSDVTLLEYLRSGLGLKGTKYMCKEGGCGACIVSVVKKPGALVTSVNSCLVSVTSCSEWDVTTIERLGSKKTTYSALQTSLAANYGSQCGHCTPGWLMAMHSIMKTKPLITRAELEKSFASNICRCTGYRPILETFKKMASDAPAADRIMDIEDLRICEKSGRSCRKSSCDESEWCVLEERDLSRDEIISLPLKDGKLWYKVKSIEQIYKVMPNSENYMLVAGNTGKGVYPILGYPDILIDVSDVEELRTLLVDQNLIVGAGHTLTELMQICDETADSDDGFQYLRKFRAHLELVAHIPVKNLGSIAGNLMVKHQHQEFQSDVFLLLATVGAEISVRDRRGREQALTMDKFLGYDMKQKIIVSVMFPPLSEQHKVLTYKIMPRAQNAHAIVNAGFTLRIDSDGVVQDAIIAFGGISPSFVRAKLAEQYLVKKKLFTNETLQGAIRLLSMELVTEERLPEPSGEYRRKLAIGLFYKGVLTLCPAGLVHARYVSGATELRYTRPVSRGEQTFQTDTTKWPLNKPIPKIEALIQCSGEAVFVDDRRTPRDEVNAAFVLSTIARGHIASIDASLALAEPGVIAFYKASDILGKNDYVPIQSPLYPFSKEVFCSSEVKFYNQAVGLIVADTHEIANRAAKLVRVKYTNVKPPVLDVDVAKLDKERLYPIKIAPATDRGFDVYKTMKGNLKSLGQYQFPMETILVRAEPTEFGLKISPTTQWMDHVHGGVWQSLNLKQSRLDVVGSRLGGAFGVKLQEPTQVAAACGLVAQRLQRPCRIELPLATVTRLFGKRATSSLDYEIEVDKSGLIQYVKYNGYNDFGYSLNEVSTGIYFMYPTCYNVYNQSRFDVVGQAVRTDTAANGSCRAPGSLEGVAFAEIMIERIATELSLDPLEVRLANLDELNYGGIKSMIERVKTDSNYDQRRKAVDVFNLENRWKKRGLRLTLSKFNGELSIKLYAHLSVFSHDGSVSITHAAVDMGQGLNTLAVQVAAFLLQIPTDKIQIKTNNSNISPNTAPSGGNKASVSLVACVEKCCEDLLQKLLPIRALLPVDVTWEELIKKAAVSDVDLQGHGFVTNTEGPDYDIFGVGVSEVEVDVLTGEMQIIRVDLLQDAGRSINQGIDVGQIEGAFIMGVGFWTCEELTYAPDSGELVTDRTWTYKVPQALDIPQDFRVYTRNDSVNDAYLGCKAIGEPPICTAVSVPLAMREAITSARLDSGLPANVWYDIVGPHTVEKTCLMSATNIEELKLY